MSGSAMKPIQWLTTAPDPFVEARSRNADAGQRGWRVHAVRADDSETFGDIRKRPALCGLVPSHGWNIDLFVEQKCARCERAVLREPKE